MRREDASKRLNRQRAVEYALQRVLSSLDEGDGRAKSRKRVHVVMGE